MMFIIREATEKRYISLHTVDASARSVSPVFIIDRQHHDAVTSSTVQPCENRIQHVLL